MWKCPNCKEECTDTLEYCLSCGTGHDGSPPAKPSPEEISVLSKSTPNSTSASRPGIAKGENIIVAEGVVLRKSRNLILAGVLLQYFGLLLVGLVNMNIIPKNTIYSAGFFVRLAGFYILYGAIPVILIYTYKLLKTLRFGMLKRLAATIVNLSIGINIIMTAALMAQANKRLRQIADKSSK